MMLLGLARSFRLANSKTVNPAVTRLLSMSGGSMPSDDKLKPFYALGINVAKQVGGELKQILDAEEIKVIHGLTITTKAIKPDDA